MRGLVVLRCGRKTLHQNWLQGVEKNWDIAFCPYENLDINISGAEVIAGHKWDGLAEFFRRTEAWRDYDYICLPDDDLDADAATFNEVFALCATHKAHLAAPALRPESYFSHLITMQNQEFRARQTGFVEIMMPCFSRAFFEEVIPTFKLSRSGTGFGLDYIWPSMLDYRDIWIFDSAPVHHTRPVGQMRNGRLAALARADLFYASGLGLQDSRKTIAGLTKDQIFIQSDDPRFEDKFRSGYAYLNIRQPNLDALIKADLQRRVPLPRPEVRKKLSLALRHFDMPDRTISRNRPSRTSSVSNRSWSDDPTLEASGANDGLLNGRSGFHTNVEDDAWWQVDFGAPYAIDEVIIYNDLAHRDHCVDFDILVSENGQQWWPVYSKRDGCVFGGLDGNPFRHVFSVSPTGRFLRVRKSGIGALHLDQVEIFGQALSSSQLDTSRNVIFRQAWP